MGKEEVVVSEDVIEARSYARREEGDLRISKEKASRWNALNGRLSVNNRDN